jgi:hypothetical protein
MYEEYGLCDRLQEWWSEKWEGFTYWATSKCWLSKYYRRWYRRSVIYRGFCSVYAFLAFFMCAFVLTAHEDNWYVIPITWIATPIIFGAINLAILIIHVLVCLIRVLFEAFMEWCDKHIV